MSQIPIGPTKEQARFAAEMRKRADSQTFALRFNDRERDTIMAALRFWQAHIPQGPGDPGQGAGDATYGWALTIAVNDRNRPSAALDVNEIDALVERINGEG